MAEGCSPFFESFFYGLYRALDKREYLEIIRDNFCHFYIKSCCDPSSEPSQQDSSDEGSQHMVSMRNKKNCHQILLSRAQTYIMRTTSWTSTLVYQSQFVSV